MGISNVFCLAMNHYLFIIAVLLALKQCLNLLFIDVCKNAKLMLRIFDKKHLPGTEVSEAITMLKYPMEQTKFTLGDLYSSQVVTTSTGRGKVEFLH